MVVILTIAAEHRNLSPHCVTLARAARSMEHAGTQGDSFATASAGFVPPNTRSTRVDRMIAVNSSRRHVFEPLKAANPGFEGISAQRLCEPQRAEVQASASRRSESGAAISRNRQGEIEHVRIGRWRVLDAAPQRRLAEVRELGCERVAVKIERFAENSVQPSSEVWQLYHADGRLEAALQTTPDGRFALLTNYLTRQVCRMIRNAQGELETVENWNI
jgi:hypothetical protein